MTTTQSNRIQPTTQTPTQNPMPNKPCGGAETRVRRKVYRRLTALTQRAPKWTKKRYCTRLEPTAKPLCRARPFSNQQIRSSKAGAPASIIRGAPSSEDPFPPPPPPPSRALITHSKNNQFCLRRNQSQHNACAANTPFVLCEMAGSNRKKSSGTQVTVNRALARLLGGHKYHIATSPRPPPPQ